MEARNKSISSLDDEEQPPSKKKYLTKEKLSNMDLHINSAISQMNEGILNQIKAE